MGRPTHEISSRGYLGDLCYSDRDSWIWEIARWRYDIDKKCFDFLNEVDPVWIDFDLDFFAVEWDSYTFVWTDEIFKKEFLSPVGIGNRLWTAKEFIHGLLDRSGLLTIATEPDYCNQEVGVQEIWGKFNHYLFDDHLKILSSDK